MTEIPKTRISLILRLQNEQDAVAWNDFVEIYEPFIYQHARRKGLQPADALDVTQEVLSKIVAAINRYNANRKTGSFRGWIATIARNTIIDFLRKDSRRPQASGDSQIQQCLANVPQLSEEKDFDGQWQRQLFQWAAQKTEKEFRETTWQAFWETSVNSHAPADVADKLGISVGAIYIAKSRVLARIKRVVANSGFSNDKPIPTEAGNEC